MTGAALGVSALNSNSVAVEPTATIASMPIAPYDTSTERGEHRTLTEAAHQRALVARQAKAAARAAAVEAARVKRERAAAAARERREQIARAAREAQEREARKAREREAREARARETRERSSRSTSRVAATSGDARSIARSMVAARGWSSAQYSCLVTLWDHESGWRVGATNPSSGAYGIPQALPGSKMASAGDDWRTNPATQIRWGLGYISSRYGTPCGALGAFQSKGWY